MTFKRIEQELDDIKFYTYSSGNVDIYDSNKETYTFELYCEICDSYANVIYSYRSATMDESVDYCRVCLNKMYLDIKEALEYEN